MTDSGAASFESAMAGADYPLVIVTARAGRRRAGCLVGFSTQASIDPPRFLACVSKANHTYGVVDAARHLAIHLVGRDQLLLARLFGEETGDRVDKFARCDWHEGPHGLPILTHAGAWFAGPIRERIDLGDHVGVLIDPDSGMADSVAPIHNHAAESMTPGHPA